MTLMNKNSLNPTCGTSPSSKKYHWLQFILISIQMEDYAEDDDNWSVGEDETDTDEDEQDLIENRTGRKTSFAGQPGGTYYLNASKAL